MQKLAIYLVRFYQYLISPFIGPCCRFHPCCSDYCIEAIQKKGLLKGLFLTFKRLCCCHPFHKGGHDPVPE